MGGKIAPRVTVAQLKRAVRDVPNFPIPGIVFKDITPVLANPRLFRGVTRILADKARAHRAQVLLGIESRGFLFGAALADHLGLPLQLVRKPGKLPYKTAGYSYELEYGTDRLEIHIDAIKRGDRVMIVDDLLATGGTAAAACKLVEQQGGDVVCCAFFIELGFLEGRKKLVRWPIERIIEF
jgi:adenine phosphoribosyltransferase